MSDIYADLPDRLVEHAPNVNELMRLLGPVVYALRSRDGLVKIGWTTDLTHRRQCLAVSLPDILGFRSGTRDDERAIHRYLAPSLARGREWYSPTDEVLAFVNSMRAELGVGLLNVEDV